MLLAEFQRNPIWQKAKIVELQERLGLKQSQIYFEMALLIALLGFVGTVAVSRFVTRGNIVG